MFSQSEVLQFLYIYLSASYFFAAALRPNVGHGLFIREVSRSHTHDKPQSVGLLWTGDQLVAETST